MRCFAILIALGVAVPAGANEPWPEPVDLSTSAAEDGVDHGWTFGWHGYVRMPVRLVDSPLGDREPYLVDDNFTESGFAYLPINETEWAELSLSAEKGRTRFVAGIFASEFSGWAEQPSKGQSTPATAFVEHTWVTDPVQVRLRAGMFWERMGYLEPYDTFVLGRARVGGLSVSTRVLDYGYVRAGYGAYSRTTVRGFSPIAWAVIGGDLGWIDLGLYAIRTSTDDGDDQFNDSFVKGELDVLGADLKVAIPYFGPAHFAFAVYEADSVEFVGESLELLHSIGGNNLRQNFLGNQENGTGDVQVFGFDLTWQPHRTLAAFAPEVARMVDGLDLRFFGLQALVATPHERTQPTDEFKNDRAYFKWGGELFYRALPTGVRQPFVALRYDRVVLDTDHESLSFRAITPRVGVTPTPGLDIWLQWTRYDYGDNLAPRREVLNRVGDDTRPDEDVFKMQAEVAW